MIKRHRLIEFQGFTLVELVLVILVIGIIGSVALRTVQPALEQAREDATFREMLAIEYAIIGNPGLVSNGVRSDYGYVGDIGALPPSLDALVSNPGYATWSGPYIMNNFAENTEDYKKDSWGDDYTYPGGVTISSNGGGSPITRQIAGNAAEVMSNTVNGNIYDGLGNAPGDSASRVTITIEYPDGSGSVTSSSVNPDAAGFFEFAGIVPIGNQLVTAVYSVTGDSTAVYASVVPRSTVYCEMKFPGGYW